MGDYFKNAIVDAQVEFSREAERIPWTQEGAHRRGMQAGFEIALRAYGIWCEGKQTIGCLETPIKKAAADFITELNKVT